MGWARAAMPRRLPKCLLCEGVEDVRWYVERLNPKREESHHGVPTDGRLLSITGTGRAAVRETYELSYSDSATRRDLVTRRLPLAPRVYWHRAVAYAWHAPAGVYEDVGGVKVPFPEEACRAGRLTWAGFARYEVDHGPGGPASVRIDGLTICTHLRNVELNAEREEKKKERERAAKLLREQSYCSRKKRKQG